MNHTFRVTINGKETHRIQGPKNTKRAEFIDYLKTQLKINIDEKRDVIEVVDETTETGTPIRHKARDTSPNNKLVIEIINRHIRNIVSTYGENRLLEVIELTYGKFETKKVS